MPLHSPGTDKARGPGQGRALDRNHRPNAERHWCEDRGSNLQSLFKSAGPPGRALTSRVWRNRRMVPTGGARTPLGGRLLEYALQRSFVRPRGSMAFS